MKFEYGFSDANRDKFDITITVSNHDEGDGDTVYHINAGDVHIYRNGCHVFTNNSEIHISYNNVPDRNDALIHSLINWQNYTNSLSAFIMQSEVSTDSSDKYKQYI